MTNPLSSLANMCRLCLDEPGKHNVFKNNYLVKSIYSCTGILHVSHNDQLPQRICSTCILKLEICKDLKNYSTKNYAYMTSIAHRNYPIKRDYLTPYFAGTQKIDTITHPKLIVRNAGNNVSSLTEIENRSVIETQKDSPGTQNSLVQMRIEKRKQKYDTQTDHDANTQKSSLTEIRNGPSRPEAQTQKDGPDTQSSSIQTRNKSSRIEKRQQKDDPNTKKSSSTVIGNGPSRSETQTQKDGPDTQSSSIQTRNRSSRIEKRKQNDDPNTQKEKRPKISVKSVEDINTGRAATVSSSEKDKTSATKKNKSKSTSADDKKSGSATKNNKSKSTSAEDNKSGDKIDHECDVCKKSYPTSKKLYLHKRSHTKNLYCPLDVCGKKFATKGDLQKHIRSHTGEKPYQCNMCDKKFTQNVSLRNHKDAMH